MDIESLRPGGLPAPLPAEAPDPVWDSYDLDGIPRVSNIGGALIFAPELVNIQTCPRCGAQLVTPQFLKLHMEEKHGAANE
jgi:hypothetical protein